MRRLSSSAWSNDCAKSDDWPMSSASSTIACSRAMSVLSSAMYQLVWARWLRIIDRRIPAIPDCEKSKPRLGGAEAGFCARYSARRKLAPRAGTQLAEQARNPTQLLENALL